MTMCTACIRVNLLNQFQSKKTQITNCGGKFFHNGGHLCCAGKGKEDKACGKLDHFQKVCKVKNKSITCLTLK